MDQDVGFIKSVSDEIDGLIKVLSHVKSLMIFAWDVELEGNLSFGMVEENAFGGSENSLDAEFWMDKEVLLRVGRFSAASRLPT